MGGRRQQTTRSSQRRLRPDAARRAASPPTGRSRPAGAPAPRSAGCQSRLGLLLSVPFTLALVAWMLWNQVQIGRVLVLGAPADGTVVAVNQCSRATAGDVTIVFTDARGAVRRVTHSSFTPGCFTVYHVGDAVAVRYVPGDPGVLMTQPEVGDLWISLFLFGLFDIVFLGGGAVAFFLVILPRASGRVSALRAQGRA